MLKLQHTPNHIDCPICSPAKEGSVRGTRIAPDWGFAEAFDQWLADRKPDLKPKTYIGYESAGRRLKEFFQQMPLEKIHIGNIRAYQKERQDKAGSTLINAEGSCLQMLLKRVKLWDVIAPAYRPLKITKEKVRQALSEEDEKRLTQVCLGQKSKRLLAGHCLVVMMNTTMGFGELRHLRRQDIKLDVHIPYIEVNKLAGGAKNDYRERVIPLNLAALRSVKWLLARWQKYGGIDPLQYVLFHRAQRRHAEIDFTRPMGHIYKAARLILTEAGLSEMGIKPYDMRSHAITKLLSDPKVSGQVAQEIAGHISKKMQDRYSRQRLENKLTALEAFGSRNIMEIAAIAKERGQGV